MKYTHDFLYQNLAIHVPFDFKNQNTRELIVDVVYELPSKVKKFVLAHVQFAAVVCSFCSYQPLRHNMAAFVIFLRFNEGDSLRKRKTTVAHEIAHAYRRRNKIVKLVKDPILEEMKTDDLCESWGFGRGYKSYKILEKVFEDWND